MSFVSGMIFKRHELDLRNDGREESSVGILGDEIAVHAVRDETHVRRVENPDCEHLPPQRTRQTSRVVGGSSVRTSNMIRQSSLR